MAPDRRDLRAVIDATVRRNTGITVPMRSRMDVDEKLIYVPPKKSIRQVRYYLLLTLHSLLLKRLSFGNCDDTIVYR